MKKKKKNNDPGRILPVNTTEVICLEFTLVFSSHTSSGLQNSILSLNSKSFLQVTSKKSHLLENYERNN